MLELDVKLPSADILRGYPKVPIIDSGERLVPLSIIGSRRLIIEYDYLKAIGRKPSQGIATELFLREGALDRLSKAGDILQGELGSNHRLLINDAYRSPAEQFRIFRNLIDRLKLQYPDRDEDEVYAYAKRFITPPSDNPACPSPHSTGGAVDLSIIKDLQRIPMAPPQTDIYSENSSIGYYEDATQEPELTYRDNRHFLYRIMSETGFVVNPNERWHYNYGNQCWAVTSLGRTAFYGLVSNEHLALVRK